LDGTPPLIALRNIRTGRLAADSKGLLEDVCANGCQP